MPARWKPVSQSSSGLRKGRKATMPSRRHRKRTCSSRFVGRIGPAWPVVAAMMLIAVSWWPSLPAAAGDDDLIQGRAPVRTIPLAAMARLDPARFGAGIRALNGSERIQDRRWRALVDLLDILPPGARLSIVQHFFAGFPYRPDRPAAKGGDRWSSLAEFLEWGGDCEEFAIAKYRALKDSGIPSSAMQIVLARDPDSGTDHAWLQVTLAGRTLILDNRRDGLATLRELSRYRPIALLDERRLIIVAIPDVTNHPSAGVRTAHTGLPAVP
ncbi:MAG: hypothetical protein D6757_03650 [Alphaproteobacteria bacterium]|nr:MAG: hypothetical protein D6757_03650 [Alphaproteobacteria bacterium]